MDYWSIAHTLTESLELKVAPVAICLTDKPPQGIPSPSKAAAAGCMFWEWGAMWALPGARIAEYDARIQVLAKANNVLTQFHQIRRGDIEAGKSPSVNESIARLQSSQ